jgi:hypothetical protein
LLKRSTIGRREGKEGASEKEKRTEADSDRASVRINEIQF